MSWSQCPPANTRISRPTQTLHKANQAPPSESRFGLLWQLLRTYHGCHFNAELPESFPILADWSGSSTPRHRSHDPGIATTSSDGQQLLLHLRSLEQPPRLPRTRRKPLSRGHARSPVRCHPMCRQWSIVAAAVARDPGGWRPWCWWVGRQWRWGTWIGLLMTMNCRSGDVLLTMMNYFGGVGCRWRCRSWVGLLMMNCRSGDGLMNMMN